MTIRRRLILTLTLLGMAVVAQGAAQMHFNQATLAQGEMQNSLADLPNQIGDWQRVEDPETDNKHEEIEESHKYGNDHIKRVYRYKNTNVLVSIWIAFSDCGKDRKHHPEVCYQVAGRAEDKTGRRKRYVAGDEENVAQIQQFRFGDITSRQYVFYWYYVLPTKGMDGLSDMQKLFRQFRTDEASVTLEVFANHHGPEDDGSAAFNFVQELDKAFRADFVPKDAIRGSNREAVTIINSSDPTQ